MSVTRATVRCGETDCSKWNGRGADLFSKEKVSKEKVKKKHKWGSKQ